MEKLFAYSPPMLQFDVVLEHQSTTHMELKNVSHEPLSFKIKTNNPNRYSVQPNSGIIAPDETAAVKFTQMAFHFFPEDLEDCTDRFQLLAIPLSQVPMENPLDPSSQYTHQEATKLWKIAPVNAIVKVKIAVTLVPVKEKVPFPFIEPNSVPAPARIDEKLPEKKFNIPTDPSPKKPPPLPPTVPKVSIRDSITSSADTTLKDTETKVAVPSLSDVRKKTEEIESEFKKLLDIKKPFVSNSQTAVASHSSHSESQPDGDSLRDSPKAPNVAPSVPSLLTRATDTVNAITAKISEVPEVVPTLQSRGEPTVAQVQTELTETILVTETDNTDTDIQPVLPSVTVPQTLATEVEQPILPSVHSEIASPSLLTETLPSVNEDASVDTITDNTTKEDKDDGDAVGDGDKDDKDGKDGDDDDDDIDYQSPEYCRSRLLNMNVTPAMTIPETDRAFQQRIAIERAGELVREINSKSKQIVTLNEQLVEARHRLSDARMATRPAYDVRFEVVESSRVPVPQLVIMAVISVALFGLLV